jgi:hypothetical protein
MNVYKQVITADYVRKGEKENALDTFVRHSVWISPATTNRQAYVSPGRNQDGALKSATTDSIQKLSMSLDVCSWNRVLNNTKIKVTDNVDPTSLLSFSTNFTPSECATTGAALYFSFLNYVPHTHYLRHKTYDGDKSTRKVKYEQIRGRQYLFLFIFVYCFAMIYPLSKA